MNLYGSITPLIGRRRGRSTVKKSCIKEEEGRELTWGKGGYEFESSFDLCFFPRK